MNRVKHSPISSLNLTVAEILTSFEVPYLMEYRIGFHAFDIAIPSKKILIEIQGEYYHSLSNSQRNDKSKATIIERYHKDWSLYEIWESEFKKNGRVKFLLEEILGLKEEMIVPDFSKLSIREVETEQARLFLGCYHYLGNLRAGKHWGLFFEKEEGSEELLIGVSSLSSFIYKEQREKYGKGSRELSRFCLHPRYQVKNLGSWFLSRCLKLARKEGFSLVVTYADTTVGHDGALYKACNFSFSHSAMASYHYQDEEGFVSHKRTIRDQASKIGTTERKYASERGLFKVKEKEKLCFLYRLDGSK